MTKPYPKTLTIKGRKYYIDQPSPNTTRQKALKDAKWMRDGGYNSKVKQFGSGYYVYTRATDRISKAEKENLKLQKKRGVGPYF